MSTIDTLIAYGHPLVRCIHKSTVEITKEKFLTTKGTCVLAINASKACDDLNENLKEKIKKGNPIRVSLEIDGLYEAFVGYGDKRLTLKDNVSMVFRKSDFICDRTVLINCDKASLNLDRKFIEKLKDPSLLLTISFRDINVHELK